MQKGGAYNRASTVHVLYSLLDIGHEKVHTKSYETLMFHRVPYEIDMSRNGRTRRLNYGHQIRVLP